MKLRIPDIDADEAIDLTPMIDCVFLLVLFFMVTSSFIDEAKVIRITLPTADSPQTIARDEADAVGVAADGSITWRSTAEEAKLAGAEELLTRLRERPVGRPVILRCDRECTWQQVVRIKNVLKLAGVETVFEEVEVGRAAN